MRCTRATGSSAAKSRPARRLAPALAAAALILLVAPAVAPAQPEPFGRTCTPREGVRICPTAGLEQRVRSFDGVSIDVDVEVRRPVRDAKSRRKGIRSP